jgi:hypothetical protein
MMPMQTNTTSKLDTFQVDSAKFSLWQYARCYEHHAQEGEILYYPAHYWHQSTSVDAATVALTGRIFPPSGYAQALEALSEHCDANKAAAQARGASEFCYSPHYEHGYRQPPPLLDMDRAGASVCALMPHAAMLIAPVVQQSVEYSEQESSRFTKSKHLIDHHQRLRDTQFYQMCAICNRLSLFLWWLSLHVCSAVGWL